ncbi:MAG: hypothetical protein GXY83_34980 [Rhodopirellula sp.]|nr:hypothetical protein [Rhodopirellula sp.]
MAEHLRERLLGYLLGALEEDEEAILDEQLERDEPLRRQLKQVWRSLQPLRSSPQEFLPPLGLAARTCEMIAEWPSRAGEQPCSEHERQTAAPAIDLSGPVSSRSDASMSPTVGPGAASSRWTWADLAVALSIAAAAFLLVFPAIENSRFHSRVTACQENLRQVGVALAQFSDRNDGFFPQIPASGPTAVAGVYAPVLLEGGFLDSSTRVVCPASTLAEDREFAVPALEQLQKAAVAEDLTRLQRQLGGSYGYTLGYRVDGRYRPTRNLHRPRFAVMADAPSYDLPDLASLNHGGLGQNFLFEDGHIEFLPSPQPAGLGDDFFTNDTGLVAAGLHRDDAVVGSSATTPLRSPGL